ncbi:hypothetical protein BEL04_14500 [Mucilaginibacter sp. PPCGB 2223]|uniref:hypothetical protein n=1 Tax=Mucilaginibacter sp. PPCGB 2223 TaxID=1886027 RepID=UPI0008255895|nr:hypothetical protein [Mucilaginibacter sp. PPCGB 2223]OCX52653.1 hypothetical protein BEL04_14500 [Mucilaginibacter sp. PPCGB 2223]
MKNYSILIALLLLCACKTRQVSTSKTAMSSQSVKTEVQRVSTLRTDTAQTITHITGQKLRTDSLAIQITPDTGIIQIVNGNYIGRARKLIITSRSASTQTINQAMQQSRAEITHSVSNDSTQQQNSTNLQEKSKQTIVKSSRFWFYIVIIIIVLTILIYIKPPKSL